MSTRGAYGVEKDNKLYMVFNKYDSYPDGLGLEFFDFLKENRDILETLSKKITKVANIINNDYVAEELVKHLHAKFNINKDILINSIKKYSEKYDSKIGLIFKDIAEGSIDFFINDRKFLEDETFCEYYYIYNLDTNLFTYVSVFSDREQTISLDEELELKV